MRKYSKRRLNRRQDVGFEASVGGGIPIIRSSTEGLAETESSPGLWAL
ncbi:MAG: hypothetical protein R3B83_02945 [Nitrospirales bacterium]|nr:hypothetical protein [Nitrospirales bacterium]